MFSVVLVEGFATLHSPEPIRLCPSWCESKTGLFVIENLGRMDNRTVQQLNNWLIENGLERNLSALVTMLGKTITTYLQETGKQISELQKKVNKMEQHNQQIQQQQAAQNQSKTDVDININAVIEQAIDRAVDKAVDKAAKAFAEQLKNTQ